jgi:hypothetical protein
VLITAGLIIGSYPHEHEDWKPWSMSLHRMFVDRVGDRSRGGLLVPVGADGARRMTSTMIQLCAVAMFLSGDLRDALSQRWLLWLGKHSFAVYLVHGTILRTVGMWIVYGITGQPWEPAGLNPDGSQQEQEWLHPKGPMHKVVAIVIFVLLTYTAAWAWVKWVDAWCADFTKWLEKRVFDDESEEVGGGKEGHAEKGYGHVLPYLDEQTNGHARMHSYSNGHANGNGHIKSGRSLDSDRGLLPP